MAPSRSSCFGPRARRGMWVWLLLAVTAGAAACGSTENDTADSSVIPPPRGPFVAANMVDEDDPRFRGQQYFLHETWGGELGGGWPPAAFLLELMETDPEVFGDQFASFGFVPDPSDDFPVGLKRGTHDPEQIAETCALCHVAPLPDEGLWLGAPNMNLDIGLFRAEVNDRWVAAGNPPLHDALMDQKLRSLGPGRFRAETASYPVAVPAAFPVYYDLGERTHLNYLGTGRNLRTEVSFSIFTAGAGNPNDDDAPVPFPDRDVIDAFVAFLGTMAAPQAPPRPDPTLVERGRAVFEEARCGACHHVGDLAADGVVTIDSGPGGLERFPGDDPDFPRGSIRTSALHRVLIDGDDGEGPGEDRGLANLVNFIVRNGLAVRQTDGYRVNDLRGLWQSAPYLHNGSVPTLHDLLRPAAERPVTFAVAGGFVVDTREPGNGNEGHEFGAELSSADRDALVEYLLSL